ncbi:MAG: family 16 glycoside hydrolase [Planctomycetota bacterium]
MLRANSLFALLAALCVLAARAEEPGEPAGTDSQFPNSRKLVSAPAGFAAYGGSWLVKDGVLWASAGAGPKLVLEEPAIATGEAGVELLLPGAGGGNAGLIVKVSQPGEGSDAFSGYEVSLDAAGQFLRLGRHRQNFEHIKDMPCAVPVDQWLALTVRMTEKSLEILVNDKTVLAYEDKDHPLASGAVGFRPWQRDAGFRNFWIKLNGKTKQIPFVAASTDAEKNSQAGSLCYTGLPPIACVVRHPLSRPPAVGQDLWAAQPRAPGCGIRIFDPAQPGQAAKSIFNDPAGCIYDMNVSYDAATLFFSYRRKDEKYWHLWRIGSDGGGLKQLTDGPYYDVSPCLLPDGDIVFVSTRRFGYTVCQPGPTSNLHRMSPDGSNISCVSMNTLSDLSPQMLPDGRVLFTRWEYIDRDLTFRQSLWTQYPDGTVYQLYFGNTIRDVGTFWQARPLPGCSDQVVATFAPHHGFPHGAIGLIDRRYGPEGPKGKGFVYITREFGSIGDTAHEWSYRDPFSLSARTFLCSYGGGGVQRYRIYLLDAADHKILLYEDPVLGCYFPLPLRPTPVPPSIPPSVRLQPSAPASTAGSQTGTVVLADVYRGLEPVIKRGQVKYLRVMEQVRKTEDLRARAYDQSPVMSYGTYYAKRCWGTVPVAADGSAHFLAPALREIYFQVLDAEGRELQRMTSAVQLMPGERISCTGCHEPRQSSPRATAAVPLASCQPPQELQKPAWGSEGTSGRRDAGAPMQELQKPAWGTDGIVDFPTLVQPVLDQHCVKCHSGENPDGGCDLSGDKTRYFNMAYDNLLGRSRSYRQHNMDTGEMLAAEQAKGKPLVHFFWLLQTPTAVNQPLWTGCHASRLLDYIDVEHGGQKLQLADRQRIYLWVDANVPYYGTYANSRPRSPGQRDLWTDVKTGQMSDWFAQDFSGVYNRRCASCHGKYENTTDWIGRFAWINLTNPQFSPALTAHLSKQSGGRGIEKTKEGKPIPMFAGKDDPDYRRMLEAIAAGKKLMLETPEADMPGFVGGRPEP